MYGIEGIDRTKSFPLFVFHVVSIRAFMLLVGLLDFSDVGDLRRLRAQIYIREGNGSRELVWDWRLVCAGSIGLSKFAYDFLSVEIFLVATLHVD